MPTTMCTAAVEHQAWRGNGAMFVSGNNVAPQLKNATMKNCYCTHETSRAARITTATTNPSQLAAPHCLSRVRSLLRLREAAERPGRQRRLRAYFTTRSWMPILRPVNSLGTQSSRNTMIYEIDRSDGQRAFLRRAARVVRKKVASLCPEGTRHRCPLGSITSFAPREATVLQRRLRIRVFPSPVPGLPLNKKIKQNTPWQSGTDGERTSGRDACRTAGERACVAPGTPAAAEQWTLVRWLGASATSGNCVHGSNSTIDAYDRRVKDARLGHDF